MTRVARWNIDGTYVVNGSVVGTISKGASGDYFAYGCLQEWSDVQLGNFTTKLSAMEAVQEWVRDHE